jgi:hypothetical protein
MSEYEECARGSLKLKGDCGIKKYVQVNQQLQIHSLLVWECVCDMVYYIK